MNFWDDPSEKLNPFIEKMEKGELKLEDILMAREKLEAVGLMKTYLKTKKTRLY